MGSNPSLGTRLEFFSKTLLQVQGHSNFIVVSFFKISSEIIVKVKIQVDLPWDWGTKVCSNDSGHMTKMATMPFKTFKNILLWNSLADVVETWYTALGTSKFCSNEDPMWTFDLFYAKVNFCSLCICMGKCLNGGLLRKY